MKGYKVIEYIKENELEDYDIEFIAHTEDDKAVHAFESFMISYSHKKARFIGRKVEERRASVRVENKEVQTDIFDFLK